jgi:hypothetical protein
MAPKNNRRRPSGPQCASHNRKRWPTDKTLFDWHRWCPDSFAETSPRLRWAALIALVLVVVAVMIVGIVFTAEYYATYYASGAWLLSKGKSDSTGGGGATGGLRASGAEEVAVAQTAAAATSNEGGCGDASNGRAKHGQLASCDYFHVRILPSRRCPFFHA